MHICLKCARIAKTVDEIENGCPCGSKVFVYKRDDIECKKLEPIKEHKCFQDTDSAESINSTLSTQSKIKCIDQQKNAQNNYEYDPKNEPGNENSEVWLAKGAQLEKVKNDDFEDEHEQDTEQSQKIENVRQIKSGIFEVDLLGVKNGPLVIRDQEGVYYVRLPFEKNGHELVE